MPAFSSYKARMVTSLQYWGVCSLYRLFIAVWSPVAHGRGWIIIHHRCIHASGMEVEAASDMGSLAPPAVVHVVHTCSSLAGTGTAGR